jgi:hypothetical protein
VKTPIFVSGVLFTGLPSSASRVRALSPLNWSPRALPVKRKRTIFSLKKGDTIIEGDDALLDHTTSFYKYLFGPVADIRLNNEIWEEGEIE